MSFQYVGKRMKYSSETVTIERSLNLTRAGTQDPSRCGNCGRPIEGRSRVNRHGVILHGLGCPKRTQRG